MIMLSPKGWVIVLFLLLVIDKIGCLLVVPPHPRLLYNYQVSAVVAAASSQVGPGLPLPAAAVPPYHPRHPRPSPSRPASRRRLQEVAALPDDAEHAVVWKATPQHLQLGRAGHAAESMAETGLWGAQHRGQDSNGYGGGTKTLKANVLDPHNNAQQNIQRALDPAVVVLLVGQVMQALLSFFRSFCLNLTLLLLFPLMLPRSRVEAAVMAADC
jgi:hypothetical protein